MPGLERISSHAALSLHSHHQNPGQNQAKINDFLGKKQQGSLAAGLQGSRRISFVPETAVSVIPATKDKQPPRFSYGENFQLVKNGALSSTGPPGNDSDEAVMDLRWPKIMRISPGLANLGQTCFLNSVLQSITHCPPLARYLISKDHSSSCRMNACALCIVEEHVNRCFQGGGRTIRPIGIVQILRKIARHMKLGRQEDAHEFYRYLLDAFQDACLKGAKRVDKTVQTSTLVHQIFGGHLQSQVKCMSCGHLSNTYDPFLDLSLELRGSDTLQKALAAFTKTELLCKNNKYRCESCKALSDAQKRITMHSSPHVLSIQLKRFDFLYSSRGSKVNKLIHYSEYLDIHPYVSQDGKKSTPASSLKYKLFAIIVHAGHTCNSGHYYSFVKSSNGTWYRMDDEDVSQVSLNTVLKQQAYMLFYVRDSDFGVPSQSPDASESVSKENVPAKVDGQKFKLCTESGHKRKDNQISKPMNVKIEESSSKSPLASDDQGEIVLKSATANMTAIAPKNCPPAKNVSVLEKVLQNKSNLSPAKSQNNAKCNPAVEESNIVDSIFANASSAHLEVPMVCVAQNEKSDKPTDSAKATKSEMAQSVPRVVKATGGNWKVLDEAGKVQSLLRQPEPKFAVHSERKDRLPRGPALPIFGAKTVVGWDASSSSGAAISAGIKRSAACLGKEAASTSAIKRPSKDDIQYDRGRKKKRKMAAAAEKLSKFH